MFCASHTKKSVVAKFSDLKGAVFCVDFGEAKLIRLTPMCAGEPKAAEKPPFKAGLGLNALASPEATEDFFLLKDGNECGQRFVHPAHRSCLQP